MKLLLFDIDGTLIRSNGAGREAMANALVDVFGTAGPIDTYHMSGKTDPRIILDLLTAVGLEATAVEEKFPQIYESMQRQGTEIFPQREMKVCPGVPELLSALKQSGQVVLGLLTGNAQTTAPLKLQAAGLDPTQFVVGVYGSEALDRNHLPAIGIRRANELTGYDFSGYNTIIIGDTPADILCARAGKATAVAVASGWHSITTLEKYQPDFLFENLAQTEAVLEAVLSE